MRSILLAACAFSLAGCSSLVTAYGPSTIVTAGGYRDAAEGPNRWRVTAMSNGFATEDMAQAIVLYRGAVVAKAAGFAHMQVVYFSAVQTHVGGMRGPQNATLKIVGVHDPAAPLACEAEPAYRWSCRTLGVETTLATMGPRLNQSPAQTAAEVAAARRSPPRPD